MENKATTLIDRIIQINSNANFDMHAWASNNPEVIMNTIKCKDLNKNKEKRLGEKDENILGLYWDTASDKLKFNINLKKIPRELMNGERNPSKREALRIVMYIFDPLGFIASFTLR
jgi:hypothetical protein